MKKTEFINVLSERTGVKAEDLISAINSTEEEVSVEVANVHLFTEEQLTDRLKNHIEKSKSTIIEMAIKNMRKLEGFDFQGKTIENLVEAAIEKGKKDAGAKPNEALAEKDGIIAKLQKNIEDIEANHRTKISELEERLTKKERESHVFSLIPDNLDTVLSKNDISILFKSEIEVSEHEGKIVYKKNGEILRDDKTQNPLDGKAVFEQFLANRNIMAKEGNEGRGKGNEFGKQKTKIESIETTDQFYDYCQENNIPRNEQPKLLSEIRKTKPDFFLG